MNAPVSPEEAGRIRDAARVVRASAVIAVLSFIVSFFWGPAYFGIAAWPVGLCLLAIASAPLLRPIGSTVVIMLTLIAVGGLLAAIFGVLTPPPDTTFRIGKVYGAAFIAFGAWFLGAGAILRELRTFEPALGMHAARGGIGLAVLGTSWFIDDVAIGLVMLVIGVLLVGGIDRFVKMARTLGLQPDAIGPTVPSDPREWVSPESSSPLR